MNCIRIRTTAAIITSLFTLSLALADDTKSSDSWIASLSKTLKLVEPRTPINAVNTPSDGDSLYRITRPGSYYLTGDIRPALDGQSAISVEANDVSIDLNGFAVDGSAGDFLSSGFLITDHIRNLVIRNGTIANFGGYGFLGNANASAFIDLAILDNLSGGLELGTDSHDCIARSVRVRGNGEVGIIFGENALVEDCVVRGGAFGIAVSSGIVVRCTVEAAGGKGISSGGGCVIDCRVHGMSSHTSFDDGAISVVGRAKIERCVVSGSPVGVFVGGAVSITDCEFLHCPRGVNAPNFGGIGARIERNLFVGSTTAAVSLQTAGHFVVGNRFRQNAANIVAGQGNVIGEMVSLGSAGGTLTAANSHAAANIAY